MVGAKRDAELTKQTRTNHEHEVVSRQSETKVLAPVAAAYIEDWLLRISCV